MSERSIRPARISRILEGSIAEEIGFEPKDAIVSINGEVPRDLIDYRYLCADEYLELDVLDRKGRSQNQR
jgi:NifB/MoaA-like Fe-S oxidoreductase